MAVSLSKYSVGDIVPDNIWGDEPNHGRILRTTTGPSGTTLFTVCWDDGIDSTETALSLDELKGE